MKNKRSDWKQIFLIFWFFKEIRRLTISREELEKQIKEEKIQEFNAQIDKCIGLRKITDLIRQHSIPVVILILCFLK